MSNPPHLAGGIERNGSLSSSIPGDVPGTTPSGRHVSHSKSAVPFASKTTEAHVSPKSLFSRILHRWGLAQLWQNLTVSKDIPHLDAQDIQSTSWDTVCDKISTYFDRCLASDKNPEDFSAVRVFALVQFDWPRPIDAQSSTKANNYLLDQTKTPIDYRKLWISYFFAQNSFNSCSQLEAEPTLSILKGLKAAAQDPAFQARLEEIHSSDQDPAAKTQQIFTAINAYLIENADDKPIAGKGKDASISLKDLWSMKLIESIGNNHGKNAELLTNSKELAQIAAKYLNKSLDNKKLNAAITQSIKRNSFKENKELLNTFRSFTFRTQNLKALESPTQKLQALNQNTTTDLPKLTIKEVAALHKAGVLENTLNQWGLIGDSSWLPKDDSTKTLTRAISQILNINRNLDIAEKELLLAYQKQFRSGDYLVHNTRKMMQWGGSYGSTNTLALFEYFSKYNHPEKIVLDNEGALQISDISAEVDFMPVNLEELIIADAYQTHPEKVITPEGQVILRENLGEEWAKIVQESYQTIEKDIHVDRRNTLFSPDLLQNSNYRQLRAGLANLFPFGHTRFTARDFKKVAEKIVSGLYGKEEGEMICSEFAAKTMIASLVTLNENLKDKVQKKLKSEGKSDDQIQTILGTIDFVTIPIDPKERLKRMHPGRFVQSLLDAGFITAMPPLPAIERIIEFSPKNRGKTTT